MSDPWLSVIVPTYNGAAYLDRALSSIASQADDGVEVIAVDDGSTDETRAILERFATQFSLRIESRGRVGNWVANTNWGLQLARAPRVCFLHQDDLWLPGRVQALRAVLDRTDVAALVLNPTNFVDAHGRFLGRWRCPLTPGGNASEAVVERLLVQNFIAIPAPVFSRQAALDVGGLDESLWYTADWDFWLKLAGRGPSIYLPKPLTAFRVHPESQTMRGRAAEMRRQLDTVLDRHLPPRQERTETADAARLSIAVNHALADAASGHRPDWWGLVRQAVVVGPAGCGRFLRDSRFAERVGARIRARI